MASKRVGVWRYFTLCEDDKKYAKCDLCDGKISRSSEIGRNATTSGMRQHLKFKHKPEFKILENSSKKRENEEENPDESEPKLKNLRSKAERTAAIQSTIPGYIESVTKWSFDSPKAQEIHRKVFEMLVLDTKPWHHVNDLGFNRLMATTSPKFVLASDTYYRNMLIPTYEKIKAKLKQKLIDDNPKSVAIR